MIPAPAILRDSAFGRVPVVSALMAVGLLGAHVAATMFLPDPAREDRHRLITYWRAHPYLDLPDAASEALIDPRVRREIYEYGRIVMASSEAPSKRHLEARQRKLDVLAGNLVRAADGGWRQIAGFIPERGFLQVGTVAHVALHTGWVSLLYSLLIIYLVGPLLESSWGPVLHLLTAAVGALAGVGLWLVIAPEAKMSINGASGALMAWLGAFGVRFTFRSSSFLHWPIPPGRRILFVPGAILVGLFVAAEILMVTPREPWDLLSRVAGFGAGLAMGGLARLFNFDGWTSSDREASESQVRRAVTRRPRSYDAVAKLARMAIEQGDMVEVTRTVDPLLAHSFERSDEATATRLIDEFGPSLRVAELSPAVALELAYRTVEEDGWRADELFRTASRDRTLAAESLLAAAELNLNRLSRPQETQRLCRMVLDTRPSSSDTERARALQSKANQEIAGWDGLRSPDDPG